jgi:tRNA nucleotidyltransferase (CCA-adding enzyme)
MGADTTLTEELERLGRLKPVFEAVAAVSGPYEGVYLVGGTVRDILLGERGFDVDIAVEGDAIAFARALAVALGGTVRAHDKFGTAVVLYDEDEHVDLVTARRESYEAPAVLPTVEQASIQDDLFRRDFTINAMAVSLQAADFGRLVDPFGGRDDLDGRTIRVLHERSFVDDPTRIFRAIRYENRYAFRMDEQTLALVRAAIEQGLVRELSPARIRDELEALLSEDQTEHSFLRLAELGADKAVHPRLSADEEGLALFRRLIELRDRYGLELPSWRLGLAALARDLPPDEVYGWLLGLKLRRREAEQIAAAVTVGPQIVERLRDGASPAEIVAAAEPDAPDAPLYALALADLEPLHAYFERLRNVRLEVDGTDLAELGLEESPRVGEILTELRRRKLNGELDGRDSELAAARELISG